jgi:hypothetical protein
VTPLRLFPQMDIEPTCTNTIHHVTKSGTIALSMEAHGRRTKRDQERCIVADKEQKKVQKAAPKSNKQKKEAQREKKAAKSGKTLS